MSVRTILHADLDAFYASVAQRDDPALRGRPVVVGGGVVLAASYEARAFGVRAAMGGSERRRRCPDAIVVPCRWEAYVEASRAVFAILADVAPRVERLSIDEAFLDVTGLEAISGPPVAIASRLRTRVRDEVGLPISVGVASAKAVAKVASADAKPDGLRIVPPGGERAFLAPLPVERVWGVGPATAARLHAHGIATVGALAALNEAELMGLLGVAAGRHLHAVARGHDPRPVAPRRRRGSFGAQSACGRAGLDASELDARLIALTDRVVRRLRQAERVGRTVTLRLRFGDFTRASRSRTLARATARTASILATVRALAAAAAPLIARRGLTLVGVTVSGVEPAGAGAQLELAIGSPEERGAAALDGVLDAVRDRYGTTALRRAGLLGGEHDRSPALPPAELA